MAAGEISLMHDVIQDYYLQVSERLDDANKDVFQQLLILMGIQKIVYAQDRGFCSCFDASHNRHRHDR